MKLFYKSIISIAVLLLGQNVNAQTYTMNWNSSFSPSWTAGNISTKTTNNIEYSGVTATVSFIASEGTAFSAFSGFTSPQVSSEGSPFSTKLKSNQSNLALGMDLSTNAGYVDVTIQFNANVNNVQFNIADIDKNSATSGTYFDEVLVTGYNGSGSVTNPTLSKLNGSAVNTATDTVLISGNIARANTSNNVGGNSPSNSSDQNGTIKVSFGSVSLNKIVIRYRNAAGTQANPASQAIAIGNIAFSKYSSLPVQLQDFSANYKSGTVFINWQTSQEVNSKSFSVEKSGNGQDWIVLTELSAAGFSSTVSNYQVKDMQPGTSNFYRLKQIDIDGKIEYSKILFVSLAENTTSTLKLFPNPVRDNSTLNIQSNVQERLTVLIFNNLGIMVNTQSFVANTGNNTFNLSSMSNLIPGNYVGIVVNSKNQSTGRINFIKQ